MTKKKSPVIKFLGENPGACPWDEAKKYFSKSLSAGFPLQVVLMKPVLAFLTFADFL